MKIVVLQRSAEELQEMRAAVESLDRKRALQILWSAKTEEVIDAAVRNDELFIVCCELLSCWGSCRDLAKRVKKVNPKVLALACDTALGVATKLFYEDDPIDANIPLYPNRRLTVELFAHILVSDLDHVTAQRLKEMFPEIQIKN